jgi:LPXTG-motif cell wall-anchored protein
VCTVKKPLPKTGASLDQLGLAAVLLAAGFGLFVMIGFRTDRPWPGRYVRRFR